MVGIEFLPLQVQVDNNAILMGQGGVDLLMHRGSVAE